MPYPDDQLSNEIVAQIHRITERARRREYRYAMAAGIFAVAALVASVAAWYMYQDSQRLVGGDMAAQEELARTSETLDRVLTQTANEFRRLPGASERSLGEALTRIEAEFATLAEDTAETAPELLRRNAELFIQFATSYQALGLSERALEAAVEARRMLATLVRPGAADHNLLATALLADGDARMAMSDPEGALVAFREATEIREALAAADLENDALQQELSVAFERLGQANSALGDDAAATRHLERALAIREELASAAESDSQYLLPLATAHSNLGDHAFRQGDYDEAAGHYDRVLAVFEQLLENEPDNAGFKDGLALHLARAGRARTAGDSDAAGLEQLDEAAERYWVLLDEQADVPERRRRLAQVHEWRGAARRAIHDLPGARSAYTRALDIRRQDAERDPTDSDALRAYAATLAELASVDRAENLDVVARQRIAEAIELRRDILAAEPEDPAAATELVRTLMSGAELDPDPRPKLNAALEILGGFAEQGTPEEHAPLAADIRQRLARLSD